jgi:hypothetical protein
MEKASLHLLFVTLFCCSLSHSFAGSGDPPASASQNTVLLPSAFPRLDYTPFGYIDNPYHSMIFNRSGVIRSLPPLGFGWWRTAFEGNYGGGVQDHVNYLSLLHMSVTIGGTVFMTTEDFTSHKVDLSSAYHSKHLISYDWSYTGVHASLKFFLPRENTLACIAELKNDGSEPAHVTIDATHLYRIGDAKWWGSDGISVRYDPPLDCSVSKIWAYGDVFLLGSDVRSTSHTASADDNEWARWIRTGDTTSLGSASLKGQGPMHAVQRYTTAVPAHAARSILFLLCRGKNEAGAVQEFAAGKAEALTALTRQLADDEAFWKECPMIEGDWPLAWKRGWVYDFETLRMNVRNPIGIFKHPWDAMQVHSPRAVLGETCLDMMTLSYADPSLAREVIYGTFADAPMPNVPCVREDGSMNMISADGSECGTAPMWGYPFHVIKAIYLETGDSTWVRQLYPHLKAYIDWWLEHRTDREGWLHCNNSWESGQDGSRRFLVAEHNEGAVADFVRTVDVEASMAEAMEIMQSFAGIAGKPEDAPVWSSLAGRRISNTRSMFVDGWFRDVDGRSNTPIMLEDYFDVMMLSPLTCGVATDEQVKVVKPMFRTFLDKQKRWLEWPPALFTYVEAARRAGVQLDAAEAVARTADRVYQRTDARMVSFRQGPFDYRIPGVANEFWPTRDVPPGGENYGWGATLPMNIIRTIIGFREGTSTADGEFTLSPAIPAALMIPGKIYTIKNLHYRNAVCDVTYRCGSNADVSVSVRFALKKPGVVTITDQGSNVKGRSEGKAPLETMTFNGSNGQVYTIRWH